MKILFLITILFLTACSDARQEISDRVSGIRENLVEQKFVPGMEDLPLMHGFRPVEGRDVAYDSVTGRIVKASYYSSGVGVSETKQFYAQTLPQLGWRPEGASFYIREGEKLKLDISSRQGNTYLEFLVIPQ